MKINPVRNSTKSPRDRNLRKKPQNKISNGINPDIFKEYDIRGIYPSEINEKVVGQIAHGFVNFLKIKTPKIVVGRDLRRSSGPLNKALVDELLIAGANVVDIGTVTTPMCYFAISFLKADAGIMVTASHNPSKYNGLKLAKKDVVMVGGEEVKRAVLRVKRGGSKKPRGVYYKNNISGPYIKLATKKFNIKRKISVSLFDLKGTPKLFAQDFIKKLGLKESKRPDFYASFDLDGDRLIIEDKKRQRLRGDVVGGMIAEEFVKKGERVIHDGVCSHAILKILKNKGIVLIPSSVGHTNIKKLMKEKKAVFGFETSGHYYFKNLHYHESPFLAIRKLSEQLDKNPDKNISDIVKAFTNNYFYKEINFKLPKNKTIEHTQKKLIETYRHGAINYMDGITIEFSSWWFNLRQSHTESLLRLTIESNSQELLEKKEKELTGLIIS